MKPARLSLLAFSVAIVVAVASFAARSAHAGPTDVARAHYQAGKRLFDGGDYRGAIAEFAKAQAAAPSPILEFNIGLCHDRLGEKAEAVRRYKLYLEKDPSATNAAAVRDKIKALEDAMAAEEAAALAAAAAANKKPAPVPEPAPDPVPADPVQPEPDPGPAEPAPVEPTPPASTGDPVFDRLQNISIRAIRDQYRVEPSSTTGTPTGPRTEAEPAEPDDAPPAANDNTVAAMPPPSSTSGPGEPPPPPAAGDTGTKSKSKPVYKQWWFWVVVGASALILINIASSDSGDNNAQPAMLGVPAGNGSTASPVLFRF
jgi:hypothetical protein